MSGRNAGPSAVNALANWFQQPIAPGRYVPEWRCLRSCVGEWLLPSRGCVMVILAMATGMACGPHASVPQPRVKVSADGGPLGSAPALIGLPFSRHTIELAIPGRIPQKVVLDTVGHCWYSSAQRLGCPFGLAVDTATGQIFVLDSAEAAIAMQADVRALRRSRSASASSPSDQGIQSNAFYVSVVSLHQSNWPILVRAPAK
jgi:hypothetical protein